MRELPEQVIPPSRPRADETGEVGSEGGSSGDMLLPPVKPTRGADADGTPGGVPSLLWWVVLVPVVVVLLWFVTSLGSR
jgi:hypothetical protein